MSSKETFFSFFSENKALLKEYIDTRLEMIKLQGIRTLSRIYQRWLWLLS